MEKDGTAVAAEQERLREKFDNALGMLVDVFQETGLHSAWMVGPLRDWLKWAEDASKRSDEQ